MPGRSTVLNHGRTQLTCTEIRDGVFIVKIITFTSSSTAIVRVEGEKIEYERLVVNPPLTEKEAKEAIEACVSQLLSAQNKRR